MEAVKLSIAKEFSKNPGPRYDSEGLNSGEKFRRDVLLGKFREAVQKRTKLVVNLDGASGYGTSFLEEAFGGLVRTEKFPNQTVQNTIEIISNEEEYWPEIISTYIDEAKLD